MKQLSKKATKKMLKVKKVIRGMPKMTEEEVRALAEDTIADTWKERKTKEELSR